MYAGTVGYSLAVSVMVGIANLFLCMSKKVRIFAVANRPRDRSERKCIKANSDNVNFDNSQLDSWNYKIGTHLVVSYIHTIWLKWSGSTLA